MFMKVFYYIFFISNVVKRLEPEISNINTVF